ncbi:UvrD-helicase domain-containing protein [Cysteiniphilum litorale]|uniref:UvrD-helicase domain-containing protein n=1 Tax=Cysteiniphilum litorale TaxID=2056700 RepID=UPI003F8823AE
MTLQDLFAQKGITPTTNQLAAIEHYKNPLFLSAGPGSGKTRVILWRVVNLMVFHNVEPKDIFLATFTEKAAKQLKDGLEDLLGMVTNLSGKPYDISQMSLGTVHSICRDLIADRRITQGKRNKPPRLLDALDQYFLVYNKQNWQELTKAAGFSRVEEANMMINSSLGTNRDMGSTSRHKAALSAISFFNRLSEEHADPLCIDIELEANQFELQDQEHCKAIYAANSTAFDNLLLSRLLVMYDLYKTKLKQENCTDFSLLQSELYDVLVQNKSSTHVFKHIIVDEYQDTNSIQEKIYFHLSQGYKNITIVGDDDQALYRFRGATVENLVEFDNRCEKYLGIEPRKIVLSENFRSRRQIVDCYTQFIDYYDWEKPKTAQADFKNPYYRVMNKGIFAHSQDYNDAVLVTSPGNAQAVSSELVTTIKALKEQGKIKDYNEVAVLFSSLKGQNGMASKVQELHDQLEEAGIPVYAPRAKRFLEVDEAKAVFGLFLTIFGKPQTLNDLKGNKPYHEYLKDCDENVDKLLRADRHLKHYIDTKKQELKIISQDYQKLESFFLEKNWTKSQPLTLEMLNIIARAPSLKLSTSAQQILTSKLFGKQIEKRYLAGNPFSLSYLQGRVCSVDWNVLDLFYQFGAFDYFKKLYRLAEDGVDEGPICNLAQISKYLARFMQLYRSVITAEIIINESLSTHLFSSFLFALFRLQESEFENEEEPFPKGRVSFLTIHQSKGLEFPVVILGSIYRKEQAPGLLEYFVREKIRPQGEPLEKIAQFDITRMFYVALSRAENVLVIPYYKGSGNPKSPGFNLLLDQMGYTHVNAVNWTDIPNAHIKMSEVPKTYSFTQDYMPYLKCPRHYMAYYKYEFVPSRAATMMFGSLVHQTLEDVQHEVFQANKG